MARKVSPVKDKAQKEKPKKRTMGFNLSVELLERLKRVSLQRQLDGMKPNSQSEMVEVALERYLGKESK